MKEWSVNCLGRKKPKIYLDTNILSYLIDNTYPSLTKLLLKLKDTCLFDLISSDFCKSEFVGIRKREHYLRLSVQKATEGNKKMNFSSLLKYHNQFGSQEVPFADVIDEIKTNVTSELESITTNYGIDFCCELHSGLTLPANDICLSSKISKEDSLVMVSAVSPLPGEVFENVLLVTHDQDFVTWYSKDGLKERLDKIFHNFEIPIPKLADTRDIFGFNLDNEVNIDNLIEQFCNKFIETFKDLYIGKSIEPVDKCPKDVFALKAELNKTIRQKQYIFVIGKNLDYMYALPKVVEFYHRGSPIEDGNMFTTAKENHLTASIVYSDDVFTSKATYQEILSELRKEGNYIFYLPIV